MNCFAHQAERPGSGGWGPVEVRRVAAVGRSEGLHPCVVVDLAQILPPGAKDIPGLPSTRELRRMAIRLAPVLAILWLLESRDLVQRGDTAAADSLLVAALQHVRHPMERIQVLAERAMLAQRRGQAHIADARWLAIGAAAERDGRPGVLLRYRSLRAHPPGLDGRSEADFAARAALVRNASAATQAGLEFEQGAWYISRGDFARAVPHLDRAVALVDTLPDPGFRVDYRVNHGRALARMGVLTEAERTLREAIRIAAGTNLRYSRAEAWHNLSHTYEGMGATAQALSASDSFVAQAALLERDPIRIISRRDAGLLLASIGWHAAARRHFEAMVQLIDSEQQNHHWAGEYHERIGNAREALTFYQRGARLDPGERSLNLAGMARMFEALGMPDSAAAAALEHDAWINSVTEVPLTPGILSRSGRHREAVRLAREWARQRERGGNIHGAALARLESTRLLIAAGQHGAAVREAALAMRHADALHLAAERTEALRLTGVALMRRRRLRGATAALTEAARLASARNDVRDVRETQLALGDALKRAGDMDGALAAYDRAAVSVEAAVVQMSADLDRARYRAVHLAPFDSALALLLARADGVSSAQTITGDVVARTAQWSARRKAAALAIRATSDVSEPVNLARLRAGLRASEAILDYVLLPARSAAIVIRRDTAVLVRLPASTDSIAGLTRRMLGGLSRRGARLDLARVTFDSVAARHLASALVDPIRPALRGVTQLTIIPDGAIHQLPFAALPAGGKPLLQHWELAYVPSLALLAHDDADRGRGARPAKSVLLVRTDVPGGREEREAIHAVWTGTIRGGGAREMQELAGPAATEGALARRPAPDIVHFATHAEIDDANPLASHLRLSTGGAASGDGLLHVGEIAAGDWHGRTVVLAACESASGALVPGEGLMGLSRAFLAGGASAVVATRWPVDATAARFSASFYAALARGETVPAATRAAQLALRADSATSHPFYWAGYLVVRAGNRNGREVHAASR